jgi:ABC-type nitrate/sulfonate/bicarbonate transport system permease component
MWTRRRISASLRAGLEVVERMRALLLPTPLAVLTRGLRVGGGGSWIREVYGNLLLRWYGGSVLNVTTQWEGGSGGDG